MKIVIEVPEEAYNRFCRCTRRPDEVEEAIIAIIDGTPLPKGHGRLFDERDIVNDNYEVIGNRIYELEPIIEADEAESEKINCKTTKCENCQNHNYCDYEPQERSDKE